MGIRSPRKKRHGQSPRKGKTFSFDEVEGDKDTIISTATSCLSVDPAFEAFPDQSLPLITLQEETNQLLVNPTAIKILDQIKHPIAVVSIAGMYRTGKSSLLNWLVNDPQGFPVASTIERCTKGIWIWGRPILWNTSQNETIAILLLDSEGLGGLQASQDYDARIFSLTTLISSKLIYNSQGSIDEKAIQSLSFIVNLANHIRLHAQEPGNESSKNEWSSLHSFFPSFLWIIRDFALELVDEDDEPITSVEYLEEALEEQQTKMPMHLEKNRIRALLKEFFRERDCMTLIRPVLDEKNLQQSDSLLQTDQLRPEFQEQLKELRNRVFSERNLKPKKIHGNVLNGLMYGELVQAYVNAINTGGVPVITSAWQSVTESECRRALQDAARLYGDSLDQLSLPMELEDLLQKLDHVQKDVLKIYRKQAVGDLVVTLESDLLLEIEKMRQNVMLKNLSASRKFCDELLQKLYEELVNPFLSRMTETQAKMEQGVDEMGDEMVHFSRIWTDFRNSYLTQARGNAKLECLLAFSDAKYTNAMRILLARKEESYEKKIRLLEQDVSKAVEELGSTGGRERVYQKELEKIQQNSSDILSDKARLAAENEERKAQISRLEAKIEASQQATQERELDKESVNLQLGSLSKRHTEVDAELVLIKSQYEKIIKEKEEQARKLNALTQENENLRKIQTCACTIS